MRYPDVSRQPTFQPAWRLRAVRAAAAWMAIGAVLAASPAAAPAQSSGSVSAAAPLIDAAQLQAQLSKRTGHVVVLHIWAACCPACRSVYPRLPHLQSEFRKRGIEVISVLIDLPKYRATANRILTEHPLPGSLWLKSLDNPDEFGEAVNPEWTGKLPYTQIYLPNGHLFTAITGLQSLATIKHKVDECYKAADAISKVEM